MRNLRIEVTSDVGKIVQLEVAVRRDTVGFRCGSYRWSEFDHKALRDWLARPDGMLIGDELAWTLLPRGIALSIEGVVSCWPAARVELDRLIDAMDEMTGEKSA